MADKNIAVILIIIAAVALFYFASNNIVAGDGASPSGAGDYDDSNLELLFADENLNTVALQESDTFSVVQLPGFEETSGIYFMRLNVKVRNDGGLEKQVVLTDIEAKDANGQVIETTAIRNAFRCILNNPVNIAPGSTHTWSTDPSNPSTGCSALSWIPTDQFEQYDQPLKITAIANVKYTVFGISKESTKSIPAEFAVANDASGFGSIVGEIIGGGTTGFLSECDAGETQLCPFAEVSGSVCEGAFQTCFVPSGGTVPSAEAGLWQGCSSENYGLNFIANAESNKEPSIYCKDGLDNDCDGTYDKPDADGSCSRGTCDYDCPACVVTFRTNADVDGSPLCIGGEVCGNHPYVDGTFVSIRKDSTDEFLTSYGYISKSTYTTSDCSSWIAGTGSPTGYSFVGKTPKQNIAIYKSGTGSSIRLIYEDDSNAGNCRYIVYSSGDNDRCKYGDQYYPSCITRYPVNVFHLANQETCIDY